MNMYNHCTSSNGHVMSSHSDFNNDAYIEYRRRVFAQLASEYDKEKKQQNMTFNPIDGYHGDNEDEESLGIPDLHSTTNNHTLPKDKKQVPYQSDQSSKSESDLRSEHEWKPTMDWSSFEEQIKLISEKSHLRTARHHPDLRHLKKKKFYLKQKIKGEAVRHKLLVGNSEVQHSGVRLERSFSNTSQSLRICYINASCSSSDSDEVSPPPTPVVTSPGFSPRVFRGLQRSRSSSPAVSKQPTIISHHRTKDRSKLQELEVEARCELARAHQRARSEAEKERSGRESVNSLVHKVLNGTLSEEILLKMNSFGLRESDCRMLTFAQLRLIINDMNIKKLALNEELVALLIVRDELKTKQDSKLVDIDDVKSMLNELGPETTV